MTFTKKSEGIYINDAGIDALDEIDAISFDCDGVLIDIPKSYDQAIIKTTQYVLENFAKINDAINVDFKINYHTMWVHKTIDQIFDIEEFHD